MVIFNSFSKAFCMTGWRVGCVISEAHFIKRLVKMQENVAVCASSISQWAALEAITHADQYYPPILDKFRARREVLLDALKGIPHLKYEVPDATFYLFTDISETGLDSREMCTALLEKEHVAITPGLSFGDAFDATWQAVSFSALTILYLVFLRRWVKGVFSGKTEKAATDFEHEYVGRAGKVTAAIEPLLFP